jgi:type 1 glutamine amidotransferase/mono/diheme cytochrome c family protein
MNKRSCLFAYVLMALVGSSGNQTSAADPPRILMLTQSAGFAHRPVKREAEPLSGAEIAMTLLGRQSGEFVVDCSQNAASAITKENLQNYDIVAFYTTGDLPIAEDDLNYFLGDWIRQKGHGFLGFHSATDTYKQHEPYWDFIGGTFDGHPWGQNTQINVAIHDTDHPAMKPFGSEFEYREEIYQYRHWQPEKVRVLMSLDMAKTKTKRPYHVPIAWCKQVGEGRMFYNNMGHREDTWQDERFLNSIIGAVRWIVGKEEGSAEPNPEVSKQQHQQAIDESAKIGITPKATAAAEQARKAAVEAKKTKPPMSQSEADAAAKRKALAALTWINPTLAAAEDKDFSIQGEYVGPSRAMQVIALGAGEFEAVIYSGGLPGAGWDKQPPQRVDVGADDVASLTQANNMQRIERASPTLGMQPPASAIVLFDGSQESLKEHWQPGAKLTEDGLLEAGATSIDTFQDYSLHVEFRTPFKPYARGQGRGNSGVYYQGRYETQVLDSFGLEGKMNETGGIYSIRDPDLNMCFPPLTWQTYDADFQAAKFDSDGNKIADAILTVRLNGVVVQQSVALKNKTTAAPVKEGPDPGPVFLQGHGNPVLFRNIWAVPRDAQKEARRPIVPGYERMVGTNSGNGMEGRVLLSELGCTHCHSSANAALASKPAPILSTVGNRIRPDYLLEYITAPHSANPGTSMPDLLGHMPESDRQHAAEAIANFLNSTGSITDRRGHPKSVARGANIYHSIGCTACHSPQEEGSMPLANAVSLARIADKYTLDSLSRFLESPHDVRPGMRMPMLVKGQEATDVATYLLRDVIFGGSFPNMKVTYYRGNWDRLPNFDELKPALEMDTYGLDIQSYEKKSRDRFGARFDCFFQAPVDGKYELHISSDDGSRVFIDEQLVLDNDGVHPMGWRTGIVQLTKGVHRVRIEYFEKEGEEGLELEISWDNQRRVPFEAVAMFDENSQPAKPIVESKFVSKANLIDEGRNLFAGLGCAACHQLEDKAGRIESGLVAPKLETLQTSGGCLAESVPMGLPDYELNDLQRANLRATIDSVKASEQELSDEELIHSTMATMNCYACHVRGGVGGPDFSANASFKSTIPEMGDEGRLAPPLDGVGDKLQENYIKKILQEGANERPYMQVNMPGFGTGTLDKLADAMVKVDQRTEATIEKANEADDLVKVAGRQLAGTKGLSCIQCHTASGKGAGLAAIDMQRMTTRLREDWFHRYLMTPTKYRPGTRMPSSFPEGKSVLPELYGGHPSKQIDALWQYLSDGPNAKLPIGAEAAMIELAPNERPIIYRNFVAGLSPRGIAVGYPAGGHIAWDANSMSLSQVWRGAFIDASKHWVGRGPGPQTPLGDQVISVENSSPVAELDSIDTPWPLASARERGYRFLGYRLDKVGTPTFRYRFGETNVEDTVFAFKESLAGAIIQRELSVSGETGGIMLLLAKGKKIEPIAGAYRVDDRFSVEINGGQSSEPEIVTFGENVELRLPLDLSQGAASIVQTIRWQ